MKRRDKPKMKPRCYKTDLLWTLTYLYCLTTNHKTEEKIGVLMRKHDLSSKEYPEMRRL